ncbi:MAG: AAA family ATPase, partial [Paludibacter sp.]|nr:AAA family ATPase [Paludibacter sp.]
MIKKIDIMKFGRFNNYLWDKTIGKDETFKKLNIIYGRNYSGKTLLARIFKSIEDANLHKNYADCDFAITLNDAKIITRHNLLDFGTENKMRVYNTDFVKENLSWLDNEDGTIKPFTILGAKNVKLDKQIKEIEEKLGKEEEKKGLLFELSEKSKAYDRKKTEHDLKKNDLDNKLRTKAQGIKNNASIYSYPTYQINSIKGDIPNAIETAILTDEQIVEKKKLLKEESKGNIERLTETRPNFSTYYSQTEELLKRQIKPSQPITDLINDSLLQEWVRQGIDKHKGKRETCGFCDNPIPAGLWDKLDAHFSKESEELREVLKAQIQTLETAKQNLDDFLNLEKEMFYASINSKYDALIKRWTATSKAYSKSIDKLIAQIKEREKDIFKENFLGEINDESENILELLKEFNLIIEEHNLKTSTLSKDQQTARSDLRISEVAK